MRTEEFDFDATSGVLPSDPGELRGKCRGTGRMVVLDRVAGSIGHTVFTRIHDYLRPGDLVVLNDSYVLSNTLAFRPDGDHRGDVVDVVVYGHEPDGTTIARTTSAQPFPGLTATSVDDEGFTCTFLEPQPDGLWRVGFAPADRLPEVLDRFGRRVDDTVHLDPAHWRDSPQAYRSVYAAKPGSLDIPSAGLHFSGEQLARLAAEGVEFAHITLHVGATETFAVRHISAEEVEQHEVRSEYFEVDAEAAGKVNRAMAEGRRVVAVGTTVMRTLETLAAPHEPKAPIAARRAWTDLYIHPGFRFKVVDVLLTNLHRPRSSHLVLTAAFAGKDLVMDSYAEILDRGGYEFDMFGDSMLIV
ncbi:S-adenosylmethionine:tRNA ribosyltransferase-isomerase [Actinosynnema sp. NPDC050436]|uniref:S-adenosylmethionine:tRNA ribosyltransferase-isomerase n=1 Tax=Actinosynnema sp. NPDC050436 TaxID=3155659 RepID=UPI0033E2AB2F